jgi:hypothetical protein
MATLSARSALREYSVVGVETVQRFEGVAAAYLE